MKTKNASSILSHGNAAGRQTVLDIIEAGINAADPYENTRKCLRLEGQTLTVGPPIAPGSGPPPQVCDLSKVNHVYVVGGGKAVQRQAKAFEDILGGRITEGHVCIKKGETVELKRIGVTLAGHPLPDKDSVEGATRIYEILRKAREGDIVFWIRSGGGTALLALPAEGLTLEDLLEVYHVLYFGAGASMPETNAVRNLISSLSMKHQKYVHGAILFEFLADEIPFGTKGHASMGTPGVVDPYKRATDVLNKYGVWDKIPQSVRDFMTRADRKHLPPTPADIALRPYFLYRVIDPHVMLAAAQAKARELGLNVAVLATSLNDIEAKPAGEMVGEIAQEVELFGRPFAPPCVFMCGGEVTVATGGETGVGGRNQEFVLAAASRISGSKNIVIGSVDSDGTDGPTSIAGGIVDGETLERIKQAGLDLNAELRRHNSTPVLEALGDAVILGNTGTNLRDLRVAYISGMRA